MSLPAWGAWVEIALIQRSFDLFARRSPHGERGLKSSFLSTTHTTLGSLPAWGAWVEISRQTVDGGGRCRSPHGERGLKFHFGASLA